MNDKELIEKLGNTSALATTLKLDRRIVSNWKQRGIPANYRPQVKELCDLRKIKVPKGFLSPRPRRKVDDETRTRFVF